MLRVARTRYQLDWSFQFFLKRLLQIHLSDKSTLYIEWQTHRYDAGIIIIIIHVIFKYYHYHYCYCYYNRIWVDLDSCESWMLSSITVRVFNANIRCNSSYFTICQQTYTHTLILASALASTRCLHSLQPACPQWLSIDVQHARGSTIIADCIPVRSLTSYHMYVLNETKYSNYSLLKWSVKYSLWTYSVGVSV